MPKKPVDPEPITPDDLGPGGRALWDSVLEIEPTIPEWRKRNLIEACRLADRLDKLDAGLGNNVSLLETVETDGGSIDVYVDKALTTARSLADLQAKLIATLRLPDASGKSGRRPGNPGTARGAYKPGEATVSAIERARSRGA